MTHATKRAPRRTAIPAAMLAALLLAGCSTGHIGESWQCPLAEGGTCDSVSAADPAVPDPKAAGTAALAEPLWRVRDAGSSIPVETACAADCGDGFDLFGWIARLFGGGDPASATGEGGDEAADRAEPGDTAAAAAVPPTANASAPGDAVREAEPAPSPPAATATKPQPSDPATALLPAEPGPAQDEPDAGDLRTEEVVARIWIAPFVDADGVYREASHVRVVLEPAGWRLK